MFRITQLKAERKKQIIDLKCKALLWFFFISIILFYTLSSIFDLKLENLASWQGINIKMDILLHKSMDEKLINLNWIDLCPEVNIVTGDKHKNRPPHWVRQWDEKRINLNWTDLCHAFNFYVCTELFMFLIFQILC